MKTNTSVKFTYTKKEFINAMRQYFINSTIFNTIISVAMIAVSVFALKNDYSPVYIVLTTLSGVLLLLVVMLNFIIPNIRYIREPKYRSEYNLIFTEAGIEGKTGSVESKIKWEYYNEVRENRQFYFLVYEKNMFAIIPKRVFESNQDEVLFRELLENRFNKIKKVK